MNWKHLLLGVFGVSTVLFLLRGQANQEAPEKAATPQRTITATGSASVTGKPDSARVYLEVVTHGKTVPAAREENSRVVGKVQEALQALKLPDLKATTRNSSVSIHYEDRDKLRISGYEVSQTFSVLVKEADSDKLGVTAARIIDVALQNGVNSGGDIEFFKADDSEMRRQSMTKAVEDGIANAQAYAAGANLRTVGVVEISGQPDFIERASSNRAVGGGAALSFIAGDWKVTSQVRVVIRY